MSKLDKVMDVYVKEQRQDTKKAYQAEVAARLIAGPSPFSRYFKVLAGLVMGVFNSRLTNPKYREKWPLGGK